MPNCVIIASDRYTLLSYPFFFCFFGFFNSHLILIELLYIILIFFRTVYQNTHFNFFFRVRFSYFLSYLRTVHFPHFIFFLLIDFLYCAEYDLCN